MPLRRTAALGAWGEEQACLFLGRQGFTVRERNYHATVGEIDIVATKGDEYYFIEVKTRRAGPWANDLAITPEKRRRFQKTVKHYCFHRAVTAPAIPAGLLVTVTPAAGRVQFRLVFW